MVKLFVKTAQNRTTTEKKLDVLFGTGLPSDFSPRHSVPSLLPNSGQSSLSLSFGPSVRSNLVSAKVESMSSHVRVSNSTMAAYICAFLQSGARNFKPRVSGDGISASGR